MRYQRYSLVKCPILCLNLLLFSDNFFSPRVVLFLIKTTKNDLEKKHAVPGAHRHIRLSLCFYILLIFSAFRAIRCARRIVDWTVASFRRLRRMDLDFFNLRAKHASSFLCEGENCALCALKVGNRGGRCTCEDLNARRGASSRAASVRSFEACAFDADGWMCERVFVRARLRATLRPDGVFALSL